MESQGENQIGRRDVIKKTAVAGAIAWTAPVILSSKALANHTGTHECENIYVFKIEGSGCTSATTQFCPSQIRAEGSAVNPDVCVQTPTSISSVVSNCSYTEDDGGTFQLQPGFYAIGSVGKKGNLYPCTRFDAPALSGGSYQTVKGQSHVYVIVCGPAVGGTCF